MNKRPCVGVALSGGVDSAVAALILKKEGYKVIGLTLRLLPPVIERKINKSDDNNTLKAAKDIARVLSIKHYILDGRRIFKERVIDNFKREYTLGRTPNPCIRCNRFIKFNLLLDKAKELKMNFIATGHYARIEYDKKNKKYLLKKAKDKDKDQSYFLYGLTQRHLKRTLLPLGNLSKKQVIKIADKENLLKLTRKESQEICFIPDNDYAAFLKKHTKGNNVSGPILDFKGKVISRHKGLIHYTVGQRKALGISNKKPLYVVKIDKKSNSLKVAESKHLYAKEFLIDDLRFVGGENFKSDLMAKVRIRYRHKEAKAVIKLKKNKKAVVTFNSPQRAITAGQAAVFYDKDIVLGGGVIDKIINS